MHLHGILLLGTEDSQLKFSGMSSRVENRVLSVLPGLRFLLEVPSRDFSPAQAGEASSGPSIRARVSVWEGRRARHGACQCARVGCARAGMRVPARVSPGAAWV